MDYNKTCPQGEKMATDILVNRQSVKQFLSNGRNTPFVMPDYQRPYSWTTDEVDMLFTDIWDFSIDSGGTEKDGQYFLGSIVIFENENRTQEIIDGQQRITTLMLMLRAIYTSLQASEQIDAVRNFKSQIEECIWQCDKITGTVHYSTMLLTSHVINEGIGDNILKNILSTGETSSDANDNYSRNYNRLCELYRTKSVQNSLNIFNFIYTLLNQVIILPINTNNQETALTIFNTLNDRGLPLTDADIFKSKLYRTYHDDQMRRHFIEEWKSLDEDSSKLEDSIQKYFNIEMYRLKAESNDASSVSSLRKFFLNKTEDRLSNPQDILHRLRSYYNLSLTIYQNQYADEELPNLMDNDIVKLLNILSSYPNDFWKYPVYIYYNKYRNHQNFTSLFKLFLRKLILTLTVIWINAWGLSSIKQDILDLNISICKKEIPDFKFSKFSDNQIQESNYITPHKDIIRVLLKIIAYNHSNQTKVLPEKWQIEHILPQRYEDTYFENYDKDTIKNSIQHIGNLIPFERKLNIRARNNYFRRKKEHYMQSQIEIVKDLSQHHDTDWSLDNIVQRDEEIRDTIIRLFEQWNREYDEANLHLQ